MSESFHLVAVWRAKAGEEARIAALLGEFVPRARQEPGCIQFIAHRDLEDPRRFVLVEEYRDHAAFLDHRESAEFKDYVLGRAVPLLEERVAFSLTEMPM